MLRRLLFGAVAATFVAIVVAYPINSLRCCNTLARPDNLDQCLNKIGRSTICTQVGTPS